MTIPEKNELQALRAQVSSLKQELEATRQLHASSPQKYQQLVDSIDGVVWEATPDFQFTFVSKQAEKILGYTPEQWLAEPMFWANHIHADDRDHAIAYCKEQCALKRNHEFEYRFITANGHTVHLRDLVHVVIEDGKVKGLMGIMLDITDKVQALNELKDLSERQKTLVNSISDFIWTATIDHSNRVVYRYFSPVIEKITGRPPEFFMPGLHRWVEVIHPDDRDKAAMLFQKILNREVNYKQAEYRIVLPDGQVRWIRDSSVIHSLPDGTRRIDGITGDITALKLYEESREHLLAQETKARIEAEKAVQLRDDFLSIATHELRTPLTPIRINLQMMRRLMQDLPLEFSKTEFLRKAIQSTENEFERFLTLVEKLLDVSRISAGRLVLERAVFDLSALLHQIAKRFEGELKKSGCELHLDAPKPVRGHWDESRLEQVFVNLLSNAMKYGAGKPIEIQLSKTEKHARIRFTDHGIGISKEDHAKVFHRFERVAPIRNYGGFGLGLFIAQELVAAHGGTILLESEPGKGATFTVELPL